MHPSSSPAPSLLFFFNDTATTEIYTLSLHDALPICPTLGMRIVPVAADHDFGARAVVGKKKHQRVVHRPQDRKSTRLNSSHGYISYAVFCLKKKKKNKYKHFTTRKLDGLRGRECYRA